MCVCVCVCGGGGGGGGGGHMPKLHLHTAEIGWYIGRYTHCFFELDLVDFNTTHSMSELFIVDKLITIINIFTL